MKKILIFTDSLGHARIGNDTDKDLMYEETWPELLKIKLENEYTIQRFSMGHASVEDIEKQLKYWKPYNPDIVIFQVGINDCLPRIMHKYELEFCNRYKFAGKLIRRFVNIFPKKNLRQIRKITYFNKEEFKSKIINLNNYFDKSYFIELVYNKNVHPLNFPSFYKKNIDEFNDTISEIEGVKIISINDILNRTNSAFLSDGFHLSALGQNLLLKQVLDNLKYEESHC